MKLRFLAALVFTFVSAHVCAQQDVYSFGVVPQQSATKLARLWGPVLAMVSERSGVQLRFATAPDIPTFEERLSRAEYDFAYMNPYHFVTFNTAPGYRALGRAMDRRIRGIVVVRKDSDIADMTELAGSEVAFPAPLSFAATLLTQAYLRQNAIEIHPRYVSSHDSVYRSVAKGLYPAGGGILRTLNNVAPEVQEQLRVLWTSEKFTPHAFAFRPGLPEQVRERVAAAIYALHEDREGARRLNALRLQGITPASDADWDDVRALNISVQH
jgi:phosphonate transport system substrate-binding protein